MNWTIILKAYYWLGPAALLGGACLFKMLQNQRPGITVDNFFVGTEMALSSISTLIGGFVALSHGPLADGSRILSLVVVLVADLAVMALVAIMYRAFEHDTERPILRFFSLAILCNAATFGTCCLSVYYISEIQ